MRRTMIDLGPGETAELEIGPCTCADGRVCDADDPFAPLCPRRGHGWLVMRGGSVPLYVRKLHAEVGGVDWTGDRARAHRFMDRSAAVLIQEQIVVRHSHAVAVVPESANEQAMEHLNRVAEW